MAEFDISSLTDYGTSLLTSTQKSVAGQTVKNQVGSLSANSTDDELLDACKQFEAYLWEQIYKEVDKSVNLFGTQSEGGYASDMVSAFSDNLIQEVSKQSVTGGDNSLAMKLYEQLKRNYGIGVKTAEEIDAEALAENAAESGAVEA